MCTAYDPYGSIRPPYTMTSWYAPTCRGYQGSSHSCEVERMGVGEEGVEQGVLEVWVVGIRDFDLSEEHGLDGAPAASHEYNSAVVEMPSILFDMMDVRDNLGGGEGRFFLSPVTWQCTSAERHRAKMASPTRGRRCSPLASALLAAVSRISSQRVLSSLNRRDVLGDLNQV
ncbi:hypothetical protein BC938DRAFT_477200 [Jimgerdemannia flammicorona]|uniref:Uncharacterized protein n=1 Tax=Jimgerdemannia flammicorona TaxID=994334 RepID=A0A433QPQ2_9FUNG|nr:hypothetical protein BC938DRAFT_477200 [Jimgerdemannia flammicorona]